MNLVEELLEASISNADPSNAETFLHRWHWLIEQHDKKLIAERDLHQSQAVWATDEVQRLRAALESIAFTDEIWGVTLSRDGMMELARRALEEGK